MGNDEILKAELEKAVAECERLREENARLRVQLCDFTHPCAAIGSKRLPQE